MRERLEGLATLLALGCFPILVWWGGDRFSSRALGLALLVLLSPRLLRGAARAHRGQGGFAAGFAAVPLATGAGIAGAILFDSRLVLLSTPVLINLALLAVFAGSLRSPVTVVESLALMTNPDLNAEQRRYCRHVTVLWCAVFVLNATVISTLAWEGLLDWWAAYTGLYAYLLIALVFSVEITVRWLRFGAESVLPRGARRV